MAIRSRTADSQQSYERCWDLDLVAKTHGWYVRTRIPDDLHEEANELSTSKSGTVVIWSRLDRVIGQRERDGVSTQQDFYRRADDTARHLRITFNDFMRHGEVEILVNDTVLKAWDPFLGKHPATQEVGAESLWLEQSRIQVAAYVLLISRN